ncbi:hypothetical protein P152DRAFT_424575 [Eremomyces bilateralis CBS 781.70]|uniref:DUF2306 domain-containing protein n=1 Tax=Eremomyces bilateralis CBS 781.70 TaxID=1392243 RepID=A0A6G1FS83_9PEZI|nr:uncharacterized protein P152DRAFT_424575 [Eremomyces bilateralis CBS 781.70]KAF1808644.1 hypothetical protein P152DRAFT_424575 [Eremomyces bilateralis CBS 781.70]
MVVSDRPPKNRLNLLARKVYNPLGFTRFYNFMLWFIFSGALLGFLLARSPYMNFGGVFCPQNAQPSLSAAPGECLIYTSRNLYKIGIIMHLCTIIPAGFLALFQFLPAIRHRVRLFHRLNGYAIILLIQLAHIGALMITRVGFGGSLATQSSVGMIALASTVSIALAWVNIRRLQIDQHRNWMLRAWFYIGAPISQRLLFLIIQPIISWIGTYYYAISCKMIVDMLTTFGTETEAIASSYSACVPFLDGTNLQQHSAVFATLEAGIIEVIAVLDISFGMALWLAFIMHAIGIELYIQLTPRESERLRQVAYERQVEAGMSHPGNAGITANRLGDANPFVPLSKTKTWPKQMYNTGPSKERVEMWTNAPSRGNQNIRCKKLEWIHSWQCDHRPIR